MTQTRTHILTLSLVTALVAGCPAREVSEVVPNQQRTEVVVVPVGVNRDVDILFVIDNSLSMEDEQISLANNFQRFVNVLETIEGGLPNIHLGVVSSDVGVGGNNVGGCAGAGDNGILQNIGRVAACTPPSGRYISDVEDPNGGPRITNYSGTLADSFSCIAQLGKNGCGFEQHFKAMERALDGSNPENVGFLRPSAFLAVVFVADEDDCSASNDQLFDATQTGINDPLGPLSSFRCFEFGVTCDGNTISRSGGTYLSCEPQANSMYIHHPQYYVDFLESLKEDKLDIMVAGIVGNRSPFSVSTDANGTPTVDWSCQTPGGGGASPGVRFGWLLDQFPNRNTFTSICNTDLSDALIVVAQLLADAIGNPCLQSNVDQTDLFPDRPGLQIDCQVSDVFNPNRADQQETPLPRCAILDAGTTATEDDTPDLSASDLPCWWIKKDAGQCQCMDGQDPNTCVPSATGLVLGVERSVEPVIGTHVIAKCLVL